MPATTDDAVVDMETKVEGFLVAEKATGLVQRWRRWRRSKGGAFELSSIASVAAERSYQAGMSMLTTTGDAAVDAETKVWGCRVAARDTGLVQRRRRQRSKGGAAAAERIARDIVRRRQWLGFSSTEAESQIERERQR